MRAALDHGGGRRRSGDPADLGASLDHHVELALEGQDRALTRNAHLLVDRVAVERLDRDVPIAPRPPDRYALDIDRRLDHRLVAGAGAAGRIAKLLQEHLSDPALEHVIDEAGNESRPRQNLLALGISLQHLRVNLAEERRRAFEPAQTLGLLDPVRGNLQEGTPPGTIIAPEVAPESCHPLALADPIGGIEESHRLRIAIGLASTQVRHRVVDEHVGGLEADAFGNEDVAVLPAIDETRSNPPTMSNTLEPIAR